MATTLESSGHFTVHELVLLNMSAKRSTLSYGPCHTKTALFS